MDEAKVKYYEPYLDERIKAAQDRAQRILNGQIETEEDFMYAMITIIDREKRMGIFAEYYKVRTVDELVFEAELIQGKALPPAEQGSQTIKRAGEDAKTELGNWIEKEIGSLDMDNAFMEDAKKFMETGEFKETEK